jgi:hypothetical protein
VTLGGTVASDVLPLESDTMVPPVGAGPFKNTSPIAGLPPGTLPLNITEFNSGNNVTSALTVTLLRVAEMRTLVAAVTALVLMANEALV